MSACPRCQGTWNGATCSCGYDASDAHYLEAQYGYFRSMRTWGLAALGGGFAAMAALSLVSITLSAMAGGALVSVGTVMAIWGAIRTRTTKRALAAITAPKALPEARLL